MSGEPTPTTVRLHLYDLSQGMARAMSAQLLGKQLDGVWHTGIVAFGQEFYFGGGIQCGTPGHTHFCLLYTSPSPRDATLSRMPSSA